MAERRHDADEGEGPTAEVLTLVGRDQGAGAAGTATSHDGGDSAAAGRGEQHHAADERPGRLAAAGGDVVHHGERPLGQAGVSADGEHAPAVSRLGKAPPASPPDGIIADMYIEHEGASPTVHPSAYVAPTATLCGDVRVGPGCRVLFGAVLTAEGGPVELGANSIVMENAVLRGTRRDPLTLGRQVVVGPGSYLTGCTVEDEVFLATGSRVFNGARIGTRSEIRINAVVHLRTVLAADALVPIGWVAVGDPARILPPDQHEAIWAVQEELDFPGYVFGLERPTEGQSLMPALTERFGRALGHHLADRTAEEAPTENCGASPS